MFDLKIVLYGCRLSNDILEKYVDYQTISPQELAKSVLYEGGWSKILVCLLTFQILFYSFCLFFFFFFLKWFRFCVLVYPFL